MQWLRPFYEEKGPVRRVSDFTRGDNLTVACVELSYQALQECVREDGAFQSLLSPRTARVQLEFRYNAEIHAYEFAAQVHILIEELCHRNQNCYSAKRVPGVNRNHGI